jgi:hypothetical protein
MNRRFFFIVFPVIILFNIESASQKHPQIQFVSFDAGLNIAGVRSAMHYDRHEKNFGANFSFSGNYSLSDDISVVASVSFSQKGAVDPVYPINTNLNYFAVPFSLRWVTGKDPKLFFFAGGYSALLIGANRRGEMFIDGQVMRVRESVSSDLRSFDYGIVFGTGMMIRLYDDFDFVINLSGSAGFARIENRYDSKPKNYHFNISLGYVYYIGFR